MKRSLAVAVILFVLALVAAGASAQQVRSYQCIATSVAPGTTHVTIYVSQLIAMEPGQQVAISGAWATYVKTNYHLENVSSTHCQQFSMNNTYQEQALTAEESAWKRQGWDVVHVTWKPGQAAAERSAASIYSAAPMPGAAPATAGGAAPAAPGAPPAASNVGAGPSASYCYSDEHKPTIYFSDAFDTAGLPSSSAWSNAFNKMLAQKYGYKGTVTCKATNTIVHAQSMILEQRDGLQGKQIVDTDWTYEPPAPGDTPPAAPR